MPSLAQLAKKQRPAPGTKNRKPSTKTKSRKPVAKSPQPAARKDYPYEKIAAAYNAGAGPMTIADEFKIYGSTPGAKYARISNILTSLSKGVVVNGKTVKIDRNRSKPAPKKSAAA